MRYSQIIPAFMYIRGLRYAYDIFYRHPLHRGNDVDSSRMLLHILFEELNRVDDVLAGIYCEGAQ